MNHFLVIKKHADAVVLQINQKAKFNQVLIDRKGRIESKSSLSGLDKALQLQRFHTQIVANFDEMLINLKKIRLVVAQDYQRLKKLKTPSAELNKLAQLSIQLQNVSRQIETKKLLYLAPKAPTVSVLASSLPMVPAHKVVIDGKTLKSFVDMSIKVSWHVAETAMRQYVNTFNKQSSKNSPAIRLEEVKAQVCDELIRLKHQDIFGQPAKATHDTPRMRR